MSAVATLTESLNSLLTYINADTSAFSVNTLGAFNRESIAVTSALNLNTSLYINDTAVLGSDFVNGTPYLTVKLASQDKYRFTTTGLGIQTVDPSVPLDVVGDAKVTGNLIVTTGGNPLASTIGNAYIDGDVFAGGIKYPSDPALKRDIVPYVTQGLPQPVEFRWKSTGVRDIGVLADDVARLEPACVQSTARGLTVDYPKLVVLCLSELQALRAQVGGLQSTVQGLQELRQ